MSEPEGWKYGDMSASRQMAGEFTPEEMERGRTQQWKYGDMANARQMSGQENEQKALEILGTFRGDLIPKFLAESIPGRLIIDGIAGASVSSFPRAAANLSGGLEALERREAIGASQPIPGFFDATTIGFLGAEIATLAALSPTYLGTAARATALINKAPMLVRMMSLPSVSMAKLGGNTAMRYGLKKIDFAEAAGNAIAGAGIEGGLSALGGRSAGETAFIGGAAGIIGGFSPWLRAFRASAVIKKLDSGRAMVGEKALAEILDTGSGATGALGWKDLAIDQAKLAAAQADLIRPGLGGEIGELVLVESSKGTTIGPKFFSERLPQLRGLPSWERAVSDGTMGRFNAKLLKGSHVDAWQTIQGFTNPIDSTLRGLGPAGLRVANSINGTMRKIEAVEARLATETGDFLGGAKMPSMEEAIKFWTDREAGTLGRYAKDSVFGRINTLLDETAPRMMREIGEAIPLEQIGRYIPRSYTSTRDLQVWLDKDGSVEALAKKLGWNEGEFEMLRSKIQKTIYDNETDPLRQMKTNLDFSREIDISYTDAIEIGMPLVDPQTAIRRYVSQLASKSEMKKAWGENNDGLFQMMAPLEKVLGGMQNRFLRDGVARSIGIVEEQSALTRMLGPFVRNVTVPSHLGLAVISNSGQSLNTMAFTGVRQFLRGLKEYRREGRLFAKDPESASRFYREHMAHTAKMQSQVEMMMSVRSDPRSLLERGKMKLTDISTWDIGSYVLERSGFNYVEKLNRMSAAFAGKNWIEDRITRMVAGELDGRVLNQARREFKKIGLNLDDIAARGGANYDELFSGSIGLGDITQFRVRPGDMPQYWSSPNASSFRMLKTFAFFQAKFVKKQIFDEARRGNLKPLAFWMSAYPAVGKVIGEVRWLVKGAPDRKEQTEFEQYIEAVMWVGGFGLLTDTQKAVDGGTRALFELGGGVVFADIFRIVTGMYEGLMGNPATTGRAALKSLPWVGQNFPFGIRSGMEEFFGIAKK